MVLGVVKMRGKLRNLIGQFFFAQKKAGERRMCRGKSWQILATPIFLLLEVLVYQSIRSYSRLTPTYGDLNF